MKLIICILLASLFTYNAQAQKPIRKLATDVSSLIKQHIQELPRENKREIRSLLKEIKYIFKTNGIVPENKRGDLVCKSKGDIGFAVFDKRNNQFVDGYYNKNAMQCSKSIASVRNNLICVIGKKKQNGFAVRNINTLSFVSEYYATSFRQCVQSIDMMRNNHICVGRKVNGNVKFVRYDILNNDFLDSKYSLSLSECNILLP